MSIDWGAYGPQIVGAVLAAIAGGLVTHLYTRHISRKRLELTFDILADRTVGIDIKPFDLKVLYKEKAYEAISIRAFSLRNTGTECVEDFEISLSMNNRKIDWLIETGLVNEIYSAKKEAKSEEKALVIKYDHLNPGEMDRFVLLTKYDDRIVVSSRKKNLRLIDARIRREKLLKIVDHIFRATSGVSLNLPRLK